MKRKMYDMATMLLIGISLLTGCKQEKSTTGSNPVKVKTERIRPVTIQGTQSFSGTVEAQTGSALSFTVGGTIKEIFVSPGQMVAQGALLAEVDDTSLRNAYEATLATRQQAEDGYVRMKQLHDNNSLPEIQWIEVQSKLKQAIAAEQIAKKNLADSKLYAPFSGYISEKVAEMGQNVLPGAPVVKLVKIDQVKVKVSIPENEIAKIQKRQTASIQAEALGDIVYSGTVTETGVTANPLSRSYEVKILVDNKEKRLLPGMLCNVCLNNEDERTAIVLPSRIIQLDGENREFVWVNVNGKASKRMVQTGELTSMGVIVLHGLSIDEEVITEGQQKVSEGMEVTL